MKVTVVGGGPSGLFFSLLLKRVQPAWDVTVFERNDANQTFGWGIVFSQHALAAIRDADLATYLGVECALCEWPDLAVVHKSTCVPIRGYRFAAIERLRFLEILQRRCREVGVGLRFGQRVGPEEWPASDIVVAADGANSAIRQSLADPLGTSVIERSHRYLWCGTTRRFDRLSLIFRDSHFGAFSAHAYPFKDRLSTFIIECTETAWQEAGLCRDVDESVLTRLEQIFADDLEGHPLLCSQPRFSNFALVRNRRAFHQNVVLIGDALETVHFSIGSGTRMALEDAIALAHSLTYVDCPEQAFLSYEAIRRGPREGLQAAACSSMQWFENVESEFGLTPVELAFRAATRSGRIGRRHLLARDPEFVARYDRQLAAAPAALL